MTDEKKKEAYENIYPGWWPILEKYIPQLLAIDPNTQIEVKEKHGTLRIWAGSETVEDCSVFESITQEAEETSKTVCEICGAPGKLRPDKRWTQTLCDCCAGLAPAERCRKGYLLKGE